MPLHPGLFALQADIGTFHRHLALQPLDLRLRDAGHRIPPPGQNLSRPKAQSR